jgi:hypothetical protein
MMVGSASVCVPWGDEWKAASRRATWRSGQRDHSDFKNQIKSARSCCQSVNANNLNRLVDGATLTQPELAGNRVR